jgi:translocation and assembly module TamA
MSARRTCGRPPRELWQPHAQKSVGRATRATFVGGTNLAQLGPLATRTQATRSVLPVLVLPAVLGLLGCFATVPKHQYGVHQLEFEGVEEVDPEAIRVCLATHEREQVVIGLSALREPKCGEPPFDRERADWKLWSWPWKKWPVYDEAVLKLDLKRIERWYQARGYYRAHVTKVEFNPPAAGKDEPCKEDCEADIRVHVSEGEPVRLRSIKLVGTDKMTPELQEELKDELDLTVGDIFDEAQYHMAQERVAEVLREAGYARVEVEGGAEVHRGLLFADVTLTIEPGPVCTMGPVQIKSSDEIPTEPVLAVAKLKRGTRYNESDLKSAQHAVYAMGAFSRVSVRGDLESEGTEIPIIIEVAPRRRSEPMIGGGVMSGVLSTGPLAQESLSVPQWDVHLLGSYTHRNFLGGLRQLRIEERPRLLSLGQFPTVPDNSPRFANTVQVRFSQPGVIEARTQLFTESSWDYGPDPFLLFFRHDVANAIGLERGFFEGRLSGRVAVHMELMQVTPRQPIVEETPSSYRLPYIEERVTLDLRDDPVAPTKGGYFTTGLHEAIPVGERSWAYLRLTPDVRGYAPLGLGFVLAARFALGSMHIFSAGKKLDDESQELGPQLYRLRGGGANSNRGFGAGQLGDGIQGGIRRWEGSLELRIPLGKSLSLAGFGDLGDVHAGRSFRFAHLNTAFGGGMRYRTPIGPIRLDVGYRVRSLARAGGGKPETDPQTNLGFARFPGAIHLTIGESF